MVEVGVFPKSEATLSSKDFVLRAKGEKDDVHSADPALMATQINKKDQSGQDVAITPVMGVEYSTGSDPNDPYYGNGRSNRGLRTTSGVIVSVNDKKKTSKASSGDEKAMTAELSEKSLPEATTAKPVAGYLYFPVSGRAEGLYELEYQSASSTVVIELRAPAD